MDETLRETSVLQLARWYFQRTDLITRNRDALDFQEVSVATMGAALRDAYDAGFRAASREADVPPGVEEPSAS
jgi:hypothetical protein